jgi:hypothetical protein
MAFFISSTALSKGITPAILKNADCMIVFVREPNPSSAAIFVALMI